MAGEPASPPLDTTEPPKPIQPLLHGKAIPPYFYNILPGNESGLFRESLQRRLCWKDVNDPSVSKGKVPPRAHLWIGTNGQKIDWDSFPRSSTTRTLTNRLPHNVEVCRKSNLAVNLKKAEEARGASFEFLCETFVMTARTSGSKDWQALKASMDRHAASGHKVWIVKPGAMNRGNGIEVVDSFSALKAFIDEKPLGTSWVCQKYIEDPLLVDGRKFDIRAYALVHPEGTVYMYDDAYVRTSSTPYSLDDLQNKALHLTNDAVQCRTGEYGQHEDSNKLTLGELQEKVGPRYDIEGRVKQRMREIAAETFGAIGPLLNPQGFKHCYELFGLDFMIDAQGTVFLIEINTSPALLRHGSLLSALIPQVVEEVVQKCIDPLFPVDGTGAVFSPDPPLDRFRLLPGVRIGGRPRLSRAFSQREASVSPSRGRGGPGAGGAAGSSNGRNGHSANLNGPGHGNLRGQVATSSKLIVLEPAGDREGQGGQGGHHKKAVMHFSPPKRRPAAAKA